MITLYTFGPAFGLPDPSPFVTKALMLLKLSGLEFETNAKGFNKAPKGKLPYLNDDGKIVADSTFIRMHLEEKYNIDLDKHLSKSERGTAWAFEKLCEDHMYWLVVHDRWMNDDNFNAGPIKFFDAAPKLIRPVVASMVRRKIKRSLEGQGTGKHSAAERAILATRGLAAVSDFLTDKPYFMGAEPCWADATIFAFISTALCDRFESPARYAASSHANLIAYSERMMAAYFPEQANAG